MSYTHAYDAADNLTSLRGSNWTFDTLTDQLTGSTNNSAYATVTFDPTGEETVANGLQYNYHLPGGQAVAWGSTVDTAVTGVQRGLYLSSGYDAGGWRDYKSVVLDGNNIHDETYLYDGDALVFRWTTWPQDAIDSNTDLTISNGDPTVMYLWGPTGPFMEFDLLGNARTFTFDPNGSCVATSNGTVSRPTFYDGYGKQVWTYTYPNNKHALRQPFQYKGQFGYYTDVHTGLCYCQHRNYDPITGRWLSRDPIGLDGGVNVYGYCGGNPVMFADPLGLDFGDWFFSTTFGQIFVGENWRLGTYTGGSAALHVFSFGHYTNPTAEKLPGYGTSVVLANISFEAASAASGEALVGWTAKGIKAWKTARMLRLPNWRAGEAFLGKVFGGESQKFFRTASGAARFVDQFAKGVAHENKYGFVKMSPKIMRQIRADAELIASGRIKGAVWHLFSSPITGRGASQSVLQELAKGGIKVVLH